MPCGTQKTRSRISARFLNTVMWRSPTILQKIRFGRLWWDEKNWLFCASLKGADSCAIVYTLTETAKANGIGPYGNLLRVLSLLPYLGKNPSYAELDKFMPWHSELRATFSGLPQIEN